MENEAGWERAGGSQLCPSSHEVVVHIPLPPFGIHGRLTLTDPAPAMVVFVHGSGNRHPNQGDRLVARALLEFGVGTGFFDLLTPEEERGRDGRRRSRLDLDLLAGRLVILTDWLRSGASGGADQLGYFAQSSAAAAALVAGSERPADVRAIVAVGGEPDLAGPALASVRAATLFIVGEQDSTAILSSRRACAALAVDDKRVIPVPGGARRFAKPVSERVAHLATEWFVHQLHAPVRPPETA